MTPWEIQGKELVNCNCSYGCPCQFNAAPTKGHCAAVGAFSIERGHYGDVPLDGLKIAVVFQWPGPIHEGHGKLQPVVDSNADARQRESLLRIMSGEDTDPFATMFSVFASTLDKVFEPLARPISFDVDVERRRGSVAVEGVFEMRGEPIRNPVTGAEHRARIDLPHGFEYEVAEIGSGTSRSQGAIALDLKNSYAQFAHLHMNNHGVIRQRATM